MQKVLGHLVGRDSSGVSSFVDDILAYSATEQEHYVLLDEIFTRLKKHKMIVALDKMSLCKREIQYLGHEILRTGIGIPAD